MRKRLAMGLIVLNLLLGAAIVMGPLAAQILPRSTLRDCCQEDVCCASCCWFVQDCEGDDDCREN
jgi:hypothetical protein